MYMHCKYGFVEADRWDGMKTGVAMHDHELMRANSLIVVRSRSRDTLRELVRLSPASDHVILQSPPHWDYEWRVYLTPEEWGEIVAVVASGLDYRNFKASIPEQHDLALAIWEAANRP